MSFEPGDVLRTQRRRRVVLKIAAAPAASRRATTGCHRQRVIRTHRPIAGSNRRAAGGCRRHAGDFLHPLGSTCRTIHRIFASTHQQFVGLVAFFTREFVQRHDGNVVEDGTGDRQGCDGDPSLKTCCPLSQYVENGGPVLDVAASRRIDQIAIGGGVASGWKLMQTAGHRCATRIGRQVSMENGSGVPLCVILCGRGNNGGDGMVIARRLVETGFEVKVFGPSPDQFGGDAATAFEAMSSARIELDTDEDADQWIVGSDRELVIVDAMLGTGAKGDPRPPVDRWIEAANAVPSRGPASVVRVAIDVPSGLDADLGLANRPTFRADLTLTFVTSKIGFHQASAQPFLGDVEVVDIGVPDWIVRQVAGVD